MLRDLVCIRLVEKAVPQAVDRARLGRGQSGEIRSPFLQLRNLLWLSLGALALVDELRTKK